MNTSKIQKKNGMKTNPAWCDRFLMRFHGRLHILNSYIVRSRFISDRVCDQGIGNLYPLDIPIVRQATHASYEHKHNPRTANSFAMVRSTSFRLHKTPNENTKRTNKQSGSFCLVTQHSKHDCAHSICTKVWSENECFRTATILENSFLILYSSTSIVEQI